MNCPNCGAKLSCGCQRRTCADGKQCCTRCAGSAKKPAPRQPLRDTPRPPIFPKKSSIDPNEVIITDVTVTHIK